MLTFNQERKDDLISKLTAHAKEDAFIQGTYFKDGRGCAVGCTLHDYGVPINDHSQYEKLFGIPEIIARLEDRIFENLSIEDAKKWPLKFTNAVPVETDLSGVWPKFAIAILTDPGHGVMQYAKTDMQRDVIQRVADLCSTGGSVEDFKEAYSAANIVANTTQVPYVVANASRTAANVARASAHAVSAAARATVYAAHNSSKNHYKWMSAKLMEIMEAS